MKIGKDKKRLKEHVLAHHTGLDLSSLEGTPSNPGAVKKVDALIGEYNRNDASSVANFFERAPQPTNIPERETLLCGSWLQKSHSTSSKVLCLGTFCMLSLSCQVALIQER